MARAVGYKRAVSWIADNDDADLGDAVTGYILTVYLVADLYGKTPAQVASDVRMARLKEEARCA